MRSHYSDLTIVVPARNEAAYVDRVIGALRSAFPQAEIIVVDNGSTDGTSSAAAGAGAHVVSEPRPGKGNAMRAGAAAATRPFLLFHDADPEYEPADAVPVADAAMSSPHPTPCMAIGVRAWRLSSIPVISFAVNFLVRAVFLFRYGQAPEDVLTGTRCLSRSYFMCLATRSPTFAIETELSRLALATGGTIVASPVRYSPRSRRAGKKIRASHLWGIVVESLSNRAPDRHLAQQPLPHVRSAE